MALLVTVIGPGGSAGAQTADRPGFVPGEATAVAKTVVLGLSPGGGKPLEVTLGVSTGRYQNRTATAEGKVLGLGLLEVFLGESAKCGDKAPIIPANQLPPVTTGDSRRGIAMTEAIAVRLPGTEEVPGSDLGTQIANATAEPQRSTAATTTLSQDFGFIALDGGHSEVTTRLEGGVREAVAITTGTQLRILGGMVIINKPRWEAVARSGAVTTGEGSFTFTSASILGFERSIDQVASDFDGFADGISSLLGGLGVFLDYPLVTVESGRVKVSPMRFGINNPPIGTDVIQPFLKFISPMRAESAAAAIAQDCNNQAVLQVLDLALGVLSGAGAISLSLGGVEAFTAATEFPEPPTLEPLDLNVPAVEVAPQVQALTLNAAPMMIAAPARRPSMPRIELDAVLPAAATLPAALPDAVTAAPEGTIPAATSVTDDLLLPPATLVSRRFEDGSTGGAAAVVGIGGLLVMIALAGADRFVMRRNKREVPD